MAAWHWIILSVATVLSLVLTIVIRHIALSYSIGISYPRERDIHTQPTPRLGGVAISLTFLVVCLWVYAVDRPTLTFVSDTVLGIDKNLLGILSGVVLLLIVGIIDDTRGLNPFVKLFFHILAGVILAASSVLVSHITNPFGGQFILGNVAFIFVVLWVTAMINVINFLDGLDGLAGGISLIATIILYLLAMKPEVHQNSMAILALILTGALVGFLPFNSYPAKLFMGDSGSQVLGFLLATFAIISGGKIATAFLVLGVPILDVVWVVTRRLMTKQPVYRADRFHLHHRLLKAGLSQREVVITLYTLSAAFGIIALRTQSMGKFIAAMALIVIMVAGGAALVLLTNYRSRQKKLSD